MRVTIIRDDNSVIVEGERHTVDCSSLPADFHALQWYGFAGEVEYAMTVCAHCSGRGKKANLPISDLETYRPLLDGWRVAKVEADKVAAEAKAQAEADAVVLVEVARQREQQRAAEAAAVLERLARLEKAAPDAAG